MPCHVVIANRGSKRWLSYVEDWRRVWTGTANPPEPVLVPWADVVGRLGNLDGLPAFDDAVAAADCFDARMAGVDLVFERGSFRHYVLEVNAFGDFFPGYADDAGRTIHETQIRSLRPMLRG